MPYYCWTEGEETKVSAYAKGDWNYGNWFRADGKKNEGMDAHATKVGDTYIVNICFKTSYDCFAIGFASNSGGTITLDNIAFDRMTDISVNFENGNLVDYTPSGASKTGKTLQNMPYLYINGTTNAGSKGAIKTEDDNKYAEVSLDANAGAYFSVGVVEAGKYTVQIEVTGATDKISFVMNDSMGTNSVLNVQQEGNVYTVTFEISQVQKNLFIGVVNTSGETITVNLDNFNFKLVKQW